MTDPHPYPVADAFRDAASGLDRGAAGVGKALAGHYTSADATKDLSWVVSTGAHWMSALAQCWARLVQPLPDAGELSGLPAVGMVDEPLHAKLHPGVTAPINLAASGFRAIGWGQMFVLPPEAFLFNPDPPTLLKGTDEFWFTVLRAHMPPNTEKYTLIFEGMVVDAATGAKVAGPIRVVKPAHWA